LKPLKQINFLILFAFLLTSCGDTASSVKRGLTGAKSNSADEFLVKKKDPLILPPDYENLPAPETGDEDVADYSVFEKTAESSIEQEDQQSSSTNIENSILKKIQSK
tara:strand:- start:1213 stop:1533 length:321 start_codon:yes stop_codon:yes gene_type:complete